MASSFGAEGTSRLNRLALNSKQTAVRDAHPAHAAGGRADPRPGKLTNLPGRWGATSNFLIFGITRNCKVQCFQFFPLSYECFYIVFSVANTFYCFKLYTQYQGSGAENRS